MKNPFFREESEIRLCEFSPKQFLMGREVELSLGARLYNYSYYVKESQLISYVDFDFSDCLDQLIKELVIGPKCLMSERHGILSDNARSVELSGKEIAGDISVIYL